MNEEQNTQDTTVEDTAGDEVMESVHLAHSGAESRTTDDPPPSEDDTVEYVDLVRVHNAGDMAEAQLIKGMLENAQVPCALEDDASGALTDGLTGARLDGTDVFVPAAYVTRARAVLSHHGYVSGIDKQQLAELLAGLESAIGGDEAAHRAFVGQLEQEPSRDTRIAVLRAIEKREDAATLLRSLIQASLGSDDDGHVLSDIALLVAEGELPRELARDLANDLSGATKAETTTQRRRAAAALGKLRGHGGAAALVNLLEDSDESVRDEAIESLYVISEGDSFGFEPDASEEDRAAAVAKWRSWLGSNPNA
jgi:hypothetical protein